MGLWQVDVLIQMKKDHLAPVNIGLSQNLLERFKLTGARCQNNICTAFGGNRFSNECSGLLASCPSQLLGILTYMYVHFEYCAFEAWRKSTFSGLMVSYYKSLINFLLVRKWSEPDSIWHRTPVAI